MASVVLYAVDISDMESWVGRGDRRALEAARAALREDEESEWEEEEWDLLDRLLERMVIEGKLYEDLDDAERYYLTQLLIDLFDEFVDSEAVSEEWPLAALEEVLAPVARAGKEPARLAGYLVRGRALQLESNLRQPGEAADDRLPYLGWVTAAELPALEAALAEPPRSLRGRSAAAWKAVTAACASCRESERDLLAFVG